MRLQIAAAFLSGALAQDNNATAAGGFGLGGGGLLGSNPCTFSPNATCYPNPVEPGRPLCCTIDPSGELCDPAGEPCFDSVDVPSDFNISDFNMTNPFEMGPGPVIICGGGLSLSSICACTPNITCYPNTNGFPPCCNDSTCTTIEYPACEEAADPVIGGGPLGSSICTNSPNTDCWPNTAGWPPCCADPSTCPSQSEFEVGVNPPCEADIGGDPLGASICTNSPDKSCWPSTNGWPPCCASDPSSCPSQSEFEVGINPPCEEPLLDGGSICTFAPNKSCWPNTNGWPLCCSSDPSTCPSPLEFESGMIPPCEEPAVLPGSSFCTETPDTECYHMGQPACCFINQLECPSEKPGCDEQAGIEGGSICTYSPDKVCWPSTNGWPPCCADLSSCPSPSEFEVGVNPPCEDPADMPILGSNPCTYAPDKLCYPSNNGWPMCCAETPDGSSCSKDEPCENDEFLPNDIPGPSPGGEEPVPAPSGEEPVGVKEAVEAPSSSTILSMSLITFVGAHAVAFVAGMW